MPTKPNILYILADDWGYGDVSCLNPESKIKTPFTDSLAARGMTFTDAHSNSAVCTPTRYGVLTGRYAWRGLLKEGVCGGFDDLIIEQDRPTVASMLQGAGYSTACIGKWHLGLGWQRKDGSEEKTFRDWETDETVDYAKPLTRGPHSVGFDYSFVIPASLDIIPYCYIENGSVVEQPLHTCETSPRPAFYRGGPIAPGLQHETCLLEFTMRAEQWLADHAQKGDDKPFFMYLPLPSPHTPHVPRKPFQGKSDAGVYGDFVVEHDWSIGRVTQTLERLGMADNTLIVVTSDNGAHMRGRVNSGDTFDFERDYGHRSNHIYRGQKSDAWDGGHRVPFITVWPEKIKAGSTCNLPICLTDLMATAAEMADIRLPENAAEDSLSLLPKLTEKKPTNNKIRQAIVHHSVSGKFAIRCGHWKLIESPGSGGWSLADTDVPADQPRYQLYNMQDDPEEQNNLYKARPEMAATLLDLLEQYRQGDGSIEEVEVPWVPGI